MSNNELEKNNLLYCAHEGKNNMWLYFEHASDTLFMVDPIAPSFESINFIEDLRPKKKYIILTACQIEKKHNIPLWRGVFSDIGIISPDPTFFQNEYIISENTITTFNETSNLSLLSVIVDESHRLCIYNAPYLFLGELTYNIFINKDETSASALLSSFFKQCDSNTICLCSFGPISLLESIHTMIAL